MSIPSSVNEEYKTIKESGQFDSQWYLLAYRDVKNSRMDPLLHFVQFGWKEGRNPSSKFNTSVYRREHPECPPDLNPLIHALGKGSHPPNTRHLEVPDYSKLPLGEKTWALNREELRYKNCTTVSVIIPTAWKCPHLLLPLLRRLLENGVQIILLNNSSFDTLPIPPDESLMTIRITEPFHYSRFLNIGAQSATNDLLIFINDDMVVEDSLWLKNLLRAFDDPTVALASPVILNPNKTIQRAGALFNPNGGVDALTYELYKTTVFPVIGGPCLAIRRDAFTGFDEELIIETSDDALSMTVSKAVVVHDSKIIHHESSSRRGIPVPSSDHAVFKKKYWSAPLGQIKCSPRVHLMYPELLIEEQIKHIAIIKIDHIGDIVLAKEAMKRVQERFPLAKITIVCGTWAIPIFKSMGYEHITPFDIYTEGGSAAVVIPVKQEQVETLRSLNPDIAFAFRLDSVGHAALFGCGAKYTAGFSGNADFPVCYTDKRNAREQMLDMVNRIPVISLKETVKPKGSFIGIHPLASVNGKQWPLSHIHDLIRWFNEKHLPILLFGPEKRKDDLLKFHVPIAPFVPVEQYASHVTEHCMAYIGMDTGPTHIIAETGMPTVDILSEKMPIKVCLVNGPNALAVVGPLEAIRPTDVLSALGRVLKNPLFN